MCMLCGSKSLFDILLTIHIFLNFQGLSQVFFCPAKLWSNGDFAQQSFGATQTLPCKVMQPSFFAPQNYGKMHTFPHKTTKTQFQEPTTQSKYFFFVLFEQLQLNTDISEIYTTIVTTFQGFFVAVWYLQGRWRRTNIAKKAVDRQQKLVVLLLLLNKDWNNIEQNQSPCNSS